MIFLYMCLCVCMCVRELVRTHRHTHTRTHTHIHGRTHTHTSLNSLTNSRKHTCTKTPTDTHTHAHTLTHKHIHPIKNTHTYTKPMHKRMYTSTHAHTRNEIEDASFSLQVYSTSIGMGCKATVVYPFQFKIQFLRLAFCILHPTETQYPSHIQNTKDTPTITSLRNYNNVISQTKWRLERSTAPFQLYGGPTQDGTWP